MRGHDAVAQALVDQGIDTVFGVLGDANLFIGDALVRLHDVHFVAATHEASAVMMAQGFSRSTGRLGVATVTHGPGLTNTMTALVEGVRAATPMLLVAGDTPSLDEQHLQDIPQRPLVQATGAGFHPVRAPETIATDIAAAVRRAHVERRPIVVNLPLEFEWKDVDYVAVPFVAKPTLALDADPAALDVALGIMASAARPLVLAGRGAVTADARDALVTLAETLGAPLCTSLLGTSYFAGEEFDLGVFGTLSTPLAAEIMMQADCVITFGAALNRYTTHEGTLLQGKRVIQVDLSPARIGSTVPIDAGVVGDARRVAETMTTMLRSADHRPSGFRSADLAARLAGHRGADFDDLSTDVTVDVRTAVIELDRILPSNRTVVVDAGRFMLDALTLPVPDPLALVTTHAFGSIGLGMAASIGAAVGSPDRPTVFLVGDGGFMMGGLNELHTAVHNELDVIVVLFNDGSYGAEHVQLVNKGMDTSSSLHHWPDFTAVAAALDTEAVAVRRVDDFATAEKAVVQRVPGRPVFIEISIDPEVSSRIPR
jgi:thiamine pyrophosphate-dependent acetolactate synthase large subunit-like protein